MSTEATEAAVQLPLDLDFLRDLLDLLNEKGASGFSIGDLQVTFNGERAPAVGRTVKQIQDDEDRTTSSRPVGGFKSPWADPTLWADRGGAPLSFDGFSR